MEESLNPKASPIQKDHLCVSRHVVTTWKASVAYLGLKDNDGGLFLTYPIRKGATHDFAPNRNILGGFPY